MVALLLIMVLVEDKSEFFCFLDRISLSRAPDDSEHYRNEEIRYSHSLHLDNSIQQLVISPQQINFLRFIICPCGDKHETENYF